MSVNDQLPAGRELDALIAERVMGWQWIIATPTFDVGRYPGHRYLGGNGEVKADPLFYKAATGKEPIEPNRDTYPHYSTDIAAAWTVYETILLLPNVGEWIIEPFYDQKPLRVVGYEIGEYVFRDGEMEHRTIAEGETVMLAICRAALKAAEERG